MIDTTNPTPPQPASKPPKQPLSPMQKRQRFWLISGGVLALMLIVGGIIFAATRSSGEVDITPTVSPTPIPTPEPVTMPSMLDGVQVETAKAKQHPLAIMIENSTDSRPQSGLSAASVVYEAITEGGITRFMAVYGHTLPERVGPVRSARTVFIDFAEEYTPGTAYYAHVGGAANALEKIRGDRVYDLDQSSIGAKAFQRFPKAGVAIEHTMYAFPEKLLNVAKDRNYRTDSDFRTWKFKTDEDAVNRPEAQTITIPFSSATYEVKYVYDKTTNTYKRYLAGNEHKDANGNKSITPKNVIVHYASYETIRSGGKDVQKVGVIGEGTAKIFRDGKVIEAKWKKPSSPGRTIYTDASTGEEIQFNAGQLWVEIVKTGTNVTVQ